MEEEILTIVTRHFGEQTPQDMEQTVRYYCARTRAYCGFAEHEALPLLVVLSVAQMAISHLRAEEGTPRALKSVTMGDTAYTFQSRTDAGAGELQQSVFAAFAPALRPFRKGLTPESGKA